MFPNKSKPITTSCICLPVKQHFDGAIVSKIERFHQRRSTEPICGIDIGSTSQKQLHHVGFVFLCGEMESRFAGLRIYGEKGAGRDKILSNFFWYRRRGLIVSENALLSSESRSICFTTPLLCGCYAFGFCKQSESRLFLYRGS